MNMKPLTRRRFLSVCAMGGVCMATPWAKALASTPLHRWNGILLGAEVSLTLAHPSTEKAQEIFKICVKEIKRLENIFTLYDSHSELSQLNAQGILHNPSAEMIEILKAAQIYHQITEGTFDVTVKPLENGGTPALVGMDKLSIDDKEIHFKQAGMGITLNGIAQGYITDRITELLKAENLTNVLVELGEKRAIGGHPAGRPWVLGLQEEGNIIDTAELKDSALATSAPSSIIFDPKTGRTTHRYKSISVIAKTATMADALSTGFLTLDQNKIEEIKTQNLAIQAVFFKSNKDTLIKI